MKRSEQINELAAALSTAQGAMKGAVKDAENPHFRSKYTNLESIVEAIRKPLADNGIAHLLEATNRNGTVAVSVHLLHKSGQWLEFDPFEITPKDKTAHAYGSATTYAKRYALCAALDIVGADEDDDGNTANFGTKEEKEAGFSTAPQFPPLPPEKKQKENVSPLIDSVQEHEIKRLLPKDRLDKMLAYYKIPDVKYMTVAQYLDAMSRIEV